MASMYVDTSFCRDDATQRAVTRCDVMRRDELNTLEQKKQAKYGKKETSLEAHVCGGTG